MFNVEVAHVGIRNIRTPLKQTTIMLRLSSQCETSVMRVRVRVIKNHYEYMH